MLCFQRAPLRRRNASPRAPERDVQQRASIARHRVARAGPRRGLRVRRRRRARRGRGRPRGARGEVDIAPLRGIRQRGLRASARERDQRAARAGVRSVEHQRARSGDDDESESTLVRVARPAARGKLYARRLGGKFDARENRRRRGNG